MLHFVRDDLMEARRASGKPPDVEQDADWGRVLEFIEEVESAQEAGDPNWIRPFSSFRDVVDALRATMRITGPLRRRALEANLIWEIIENTKELLFHSDQGTGPKTLWLSTEHVPLPRRGEREIRVDHRGAFRMFNFKIGLPRLATQSQSALDAAVDSGEFLDYDPAVNAFVVGPLHRCLLDLRQQFVRLTGLAESLNNTAEISADMARAVAAARDRTSVSVSDYTVLFLHAARDAMENILRLNGAIYRALVSVDPVVPPALLPTYPRSPDENTSREDVTSAEAERWLRMGRLPDRAPGAN